MAKVIIHTTLALDGFMARPNDAIDWAFKYAPDDLKVEDIELERTELIATGGITSLRFRVILN